MPYKDAAVRREYDRRRKRAWRETHRPLSTAEIEDRIRSLGLAPTDPRPTVVSIDEPSGAAELDRQAYRDWSAIPFDGDEAGLEDPEDSWNEAN